MTPEELDRARSDEAWRIWERQPDSLPETATIAARLAREGWMPPKPVDPDLLIAREASAQEWEGRSGDSDTARRTRNGWLDDGKAVTACLLAARMAREQEQERAKGLVEPAEAIVNRAVRGTGSNDLRWPHILKADRRLEEGLTAYKAGKAAR